MVPTPLHGDREVERRPLSRAPLRPDAPAMVFDNFSANRQANPRARIVRAGVQALKNAKDALGLVRVKADAVILHGEQPGVALGLGGDMHLRRTRAAVLESVPDQILQEPGQLPRRTAHGGQGIMGHPGAAFLDGAGQAGAHLLQ